MFRNGGNMGDPLYRSRSRNAAEARSAAMPEKTRRRQIRNWAILVGIVVVVLVAVQFLRGYNRGREISLTRLPCYSNQNVTPFRDGLIYYDGMSLHHLSSTGTIRWSFPAGQEATFSVGPTHLAIWSGTQLFLVDQNGKATYNEGMEGVVQFARVGDRYAAVVVGEDTEPKLIVKDLNGAQVDAEAEAFSGLIMLDTGFYGDQGQYLWTLAMDVFGTAPNTIMNTFQVGKMNTGEVSLGENITYRVIYENARLRVFTTQQMYTYDYKCVQDTNATMLVYGWKVIDVDIPERGAARILLAPTSQTSGSQIISELRVLEGATDRRYTLPTSCVGACIWKGNIYAISGQMVFRANISGQRFTSFAIPVPDGVVIDGFYGVTADGKMLLSSGETMYALSVPQN